MRLSVIIPVYNEIDTIAEIIARVQAVELSISVWSGHAREDRITLEREIVIVDDGSQDGTREYLNTLRGAPEIQERQEIAGNAGQQETGKRPGTISPFRKEHSICRQLAPVQSQTSAAEPAPSQQSLPRHTLPVCYRASGNCRHRNAQD